MSGGGLILLYHRVHVLERDPQLLCVAPQRFDDHLRVLNADWTPMTLADMVRCAARGEVADRAVAVTFDDGYADNLEDAAPRLIESGIPATFFICADPLGDEGEFWWDELERIALASERLPDELDLPLDGPLDGRALRWRSTQSVHPTQVVHSKTPLPPWGRGQGEGVFGARNDDGQRRPDDGPAPPDWNVTRQNGETDRTRLYRQCFAALQPLTAADRRRAVRALRKWAGTEGAPRSSHRRLDAEGIARLAGLDGMEVGGHTVSHPRLASLSSEAQYAEIRNNQTYLAEIVDRPVDGFSYPFGTRADYDADTVTHVRRCEFARACANRPGWVTADASVFELPRFVVRDWDADVFARQLERWRGS